MARVLTEHLTKHFPRPGGEPVRAVEDVSLALEEKELLVLVGPSGSGKTTVLRLIAGLDQPDWGTILIDGHPASRLAPKDRDVAMVFQTPALYPHLNVYDNMGFGLRVRGLAKTEIRERVREAAELLRLTGFLERLPASLSGGQRQLVALGRALVRRPRVFLLDEPLSHLDAPTREQMRAEILRIHRNLGASMLYVTHDQGEALALGDRIAVIRGGVLQQTDVPLAVYHRPANLFVAGFIGSPRINLVPGAIQSRAGQLVFVATPTIVAESSSPDFELSLPSEAAPRWPLHDEKQVLFGIRPEHVLVFSSDSAAPHKLKAHADLVQPLGAETIATLKLGTQTLLARLPGAHSLQRGQIVSISFEMRFAQFFDPETKQNIS